MHAQIFYEPENMRLEEVPVPEIGEDEVLVRVKATGICGSDIAYYFGVSSLETESGKGPLILGHELTGEVTQVGSVARKLFREGDRVVLNPVQYCNACPLCLKGQVNLCENKTVLGVSVDGGFAEYCKAKATAAVKLPDNVSYEAGALTEPLADAVYAVQNADLHLGDSVAIFGPGTIGLMMVQLAKVSGAGQLFLIGTRDERLRLGGQFGADVLLNTAQPESEFYCADLPAAIAERTNGLMVDRAITATGSLDAMHAALAITGRRSVIVFFGLPGDKDVIQVPALRSILWDKTIRFSWLSPLTWPRALQALATGLVDVQPLLTHRYALPDLIPALGEVRAREGGAIKAVVKP